MSDTPAWISVGALGEAFSSHSYVRPKTADLVDQTLHLNFEDGRAIAYAFKSDCDLASSTAKNDVQTVPVDETYWAMCVRDGIYFVDHVKQAERATAASLVLDLARNIFTAVSSTLPTGAEVRQGLLSRVAKGCELTGVAVDIQQGAINAAFLPSTLRHPKTLELVNKRIEYTYSPTEQYEHIYLNESFFTWHCLKGSEKGLADTDRCHYYKIAEQLYLFVWREKIVPTLGVVIVDLGAMKTAGKIFGYQGHDFGKPVTFAVGAKARLLNVTER